MVLKASYYYLLRSGMGMSERAEEGVKTNEDSPTATLPQMNDVEIKSTQEKISFRLMRHQIG